MQKAVRAPLRRRALIASLVALAAAGLTAGAVLGSSSGATTATPSTQTRELTALRARLTVAERDAKFWQQLVQNFRPATSLKLNSMSDHRVLALPSGLVLALHFDSMNLANAKNLNWIAVGIPGIFTQADKARVNRLYGPGINHFHDLKTDVHGGKRGVSGIWFLHIGARTFTSPFGKVAPGRVDPNFMPTAPPK